MTPEREEKIRQRAYQIWEAEGRPDGKQDEHWQRAAREIEAEEPGEPQIDASDVGSTPGVPGGVQQGTAQETDAAPGEGRGAGDRRSAAKRGRNTGIFRPEDD